MGEPWRPWERSGVLEREVASLRETWQGRQRLARSAATSEGRQRRQRVGSDVRGSAATSEGRQRRQRVGSDVRGSAATSDGQQERYGVPGMDVAFSG